MTKVEGFKFEYSGETLMFNCGLYSNNRIAIKLLCDEGIHCVLTVNLPDEKLEDDEMFIKTWSENKPIIQSVKETGLFIDTGKRVQTVFCEAQVWKLADHVCVKSFNDLDNDVSISKETIFNKIKSYEGMPNINVVRESIVSELVDMFNESDSKC